MLGGGGGGQRRVEKGRGKRREWGVQGICTAWADWGRRRECEKQL